MPPNGYQSVSLDDDTLATVDDYNSELPDCDGRPDVLRAAVEAFDVTEYQS